MARLAIALVLIGSIACGIFLVLYMDKTGRSGNRLDKAYQYDSEPIPPTDPAMIHYRQVLEIPTGLAELSAVAVASDDCIYAAGDRAVRVFDSAGKLLRRIALDDSPRCLCVDATGRLYVAMKDHVEVLDSAGVRIARWQNLGKAATISSIAVSPDGRHVLAADRGQNYVVRFDAQGQIAGYIGRDEETGKGNHFFVQTVRCFDLAIGGDGQVRIVDPANHTIEVYSLDGTLDSRIRKEGAGIENFHGCCNPTDIAILGDGSIVTAEKGTGLPRIKVYSPAGQLTSVVAPPGSFQDDAALLDLAVDSRGRIAAIDPGRKSIRVFEKK